MLKSITYRNLGYNEGIDDTIAQNAVQITRHAHTNECNCKGSIQRYNESHNSGDGWWSDTYDYRCSVCSYTCSNTYTYHSYNGWVGDPAISGTYPIPTSCPNKICGKATGVSIDAIKVNGITYNIKDGTVTEE